MLTYWHADFDDFLVAMISQAHLPKPSNNADFPRYDSPRLKIQVPELGRKTVSRKQSYSARIHRL